RIWTGYLYRRRQRSQRETCRGAYYLRFQGIYGTRYQIRYWYGGNRQSSCNRETHTRTAHHYAARYSGAWIYLLPLHDRRHHQYALPPAHLWGRARRRRCTERPPGERRTFSDCRRAGLTQKTTGPSTSTHPGRTGRGIKWQVTLCNP